MVLWEPVANNPHRRRGLPVSLTPGCPEWGLEVPQVKLCMYSHFQSSTTLPSEIWHQSTFPKYPKPPVLTGSANNCFLLQICRTRMCIKVESNLKGHYLSNVCIFPLKAHFSLCLLPSSSPPRFVFVLVLRLPLSQPSHRAFAF